MACVSDKCSKLFYFLKLCVKKLHTLQNIYVHYVAWTHERKNNFCKQSVRPSSDHTCHDSYRDCNIVCVCMLVIYYLWRLMEPHFKKDGRIDIEETLSYVCFLCKWYNICMFMFLGDSWSRLTSSFQHLWVRIACTRPDKGGASSRPLPVLSVSTFVFNARNEAWRRFLATTKMFFSQSCAWKLSLVWWWSSTKGIDYRIHIQWSSPECWFSGKRSHWLECS